MLWHIQVTALVHDASAVITVMWSRKLKRLSQCAPKLLQSTCAQCNSGDCSSMRQENGPQGWRSCLSQQNNEIMKGIHTLWRWEPLQQSKWISFIYKHWACCRSQRFTTQLITGEEVFTCLHRTGSCGRAQHCKAVTVFESAQPSFMQRQILFHGLTSFS